MDFLEVLEKRFSSRSYLKKSVSRELALVLVDTAIKAPSACNLQLTQYIFLDDPALIKKLAEEVDSKFNWAPNFFIVLYDAFFMAKRDAVLLSVGMAIENILLGATELGIGVCPLTGFKKEEKMKQILGIADRYKVAALIACGYADGAVFKQRVPRIGASEALSFNYHQGLKSLNNGNCAGKLSLIDLIDYRRRIAPVYLDNFRLASWPGYFYEDAFNFIFKKILSKNRPGKLLDLFTYDAVFFKHLCKESGLGGTEIMASDYLDNNLKFYKNFFGKDGILMKEDNKLEARNDFFDFITFIFKAEFTPDLDLLIKEASLKLKKGGKIFIVFAQEGLSKRLAKFFLSVFGRLKKERMNIYENNPHYKIGFYKFLSDGVLKKNILGAGFKIEFSGIIKKYSSLMITSKFYLASKQ